jgi:hypothetical protein
LSEVAAIASAEQATNWARNAITSKNTLIVADAEAIEQAFERSLIELSGAADAEAEPLTEPGQGSGKLPGQSETLQESGGQPQSEEPAEVGTERANLPLSSSAVETTRVTPVEPPTGIDKSVLAISEPKRHRNKEHLRFVAHQPCLICGRTPSDPHHLRFAQQRALGRKVSDEFVVPLCRSHHRALHRVGNELGWWKATSIDPLDVARRLWGQSRLIEQADPAPVQAAFQPLFVTAESQPGNPQTPRRSGRRSTKSGGRAQTNGRLA